MERSHREAAAEGAAGAAAAPSAVGKQTLTGAIVQRSASGAATADEPTATFGAATAGGGGEVPYRGEMEQAFGHSFANVQAYTGRGAEMSALGATAAASGEQIAFGTTSPDRGLVAHELTHVVQARHSGGGGVHAKALSEPGDASEREADAVASRVSAGHAAGPIVESAGPGIHRNMDSVPGVGALHAPPDPNAMQVENDPDTERRNAPAEDTPLPWNRGGDGWNAQQILTYLGQHDRSAQTDSDGSRCVQAVGLASHVLQGPTAVIGWLGSTGMGGMLEGRQPPPRVLAASRVMHTVADRLRARTATYGDLSWAQEAAHDIYYGDDAGTPGEDVRTRIVPPLDMSTMQNLSVWCSTPAEVMAQATSLAEGQQLVITAWQVLFNSAYDQLGPQDQGDDITVTIVSADGQHRRQAHIHRIQVPPKPRPSQINLDRDSQSGHQLLIYKSGGQIYLYEPEFTDPGTHVSSLGAAGPQLAHYLRDDVQLGSYGYVQVLGKITPFQNPFTQPAQGAPAAP